MFVVLLCLMSMSSNVYGVRIWVFGLVLCGVTIKISVSRANSTKQASCTVSNTVKYPLKRLYLLYQTFLVWYCIMLCWKNNCSMQN